MSSQTVLTEEEYRRRPNQDFSDEYFVVYDEPDTHGYWGRRLELRFRASGKDAHEAVLARFHEIKCGTPVQVYNITYV